MLDTMRKINGREWKGHLENKIVRNLVYVNKDILNRWQKKINY